jgi:hypothetical protein
MDYTAHRGESWRIDRLAKAAGVFCTIAGIHRKQLDLLVLRLTDDKGQLIVEWVEQPSMRLMYAFDDAWKLCGEQVSWHTAPDLAGVRRPVAGWQAIA